MKNRGIIKEMLRQGLSPEEVKEKLREKGISEKLYHIYWLTSLFVAAFIWLLPAIARWVGWRFLRFFAGLSSIEFSFAIKVLGVLFIIAGISLISQSSYRRKKLGGLQDVDETIYIIKEGPYRIVRHPDFLGQLFLFPSIPVILSKWIPFTILGVIYWFLIIGTIVVFILTEERFNLKKWGEEYRKYQREVPALNFIIGLWRIKNQGVKL